MRRFIVSLPAIALVAVLLVAMVQSVAVACPTCGEALGHQDASHAGVAKGFYYSILFMMGTPYLILGAFCGCMYWKVRRTRAARAGKADPPVPPAAGSKSAIAPTTPASFAETREPVEV